LSDKRSCECIRIIANSRQIKKRVLYEYCVEQYASGALYAPATSIGPVKAATTSLSPLRTPGVTRIYKTNGKTRLHFDTNNVKHKQVSVLFWASGGPR
jgi:hypothetical protein